MRDGMQMHIDLYLSPRGDDLEYQILNHRGTSLCHPALPYICETPPKPTFMNTFLPFDLLGLGWMDCRSQFDWHGPSDVQTCGFYSFRMGWGYEDEMMRKKSNLKICHLLIYGWHQRRRHRSFFQYLFSSEELMPSAKEWMLTRSVFGGDRDTYELWFLNGLDQYQSINHARIHSRI